MTDDLLLLHDAPPGEGTLLNPQRVHERLLGLAERGEWTELGRLGEEFVRLISKTLGLYVICRHMASLPPHYEAADVDALAECTWKVGAGQQITARRGASAELEIEAKSYNAINYLPNDHDMRGDLWFRPDVARSAMEGRGLPVYVLFHVRTHYRHRSPAKPRARIRPPPQLPFEFGPAIPPQPPNVGDHVSAAARAAQHHAMFEAYAEAHHRHEGGKRMRVPSDSSMLPHHDLLAPPPIAMHAHHHNLAMAQQPPMPLPPPLIPSSLALPTSTSPHQTAPHQTEERRRAAALALIRL